MTVRTTNLILPKDAEATLTDQYTTVNCEAIIDKFTATNELVSPVVLSVHIIPSGGVASNTNRILSLRSIAPNETYLCPELVGHLIPNGGRISTLASSTGLTIAATGREIT